MKRRSGLRLGELVCACALALLMVRDSNAATKTVDLDGNSTNGAESQCDLNLISMSPVTFENVVTNRTGGNAFNFSWSSAGPGGFTSSVPAGTTGGVGSRWVWTTNQSVVSYTGSVCANDICFSKTSGPDPIAGTCSLCTDDGVAFTLQKGPGPGETTLNWLGGQGPYTVRRAAVARNIGDAASSLLTTDLLRFTDTPPAGAIFFYQVRGTICVLRKSCSTDTDCFAPTDGTCTSRGPFGVPGRSLSSSNVTVSSASLTSSLITFFSPPTEVFRVTSTAGPGGVSETATNTGTQPVTTTIPAYPPGCCPPDGKVLHQLRCGEICVDYLFDPANCGACGNVCSEGTFCQDGTCLLSCDEGQYDCFGQCVSLDNDNYNCGDCGDVCDEGTYCSSGYCQSACDEGQALCSDLCVFLDWDNDNCGACGHACGEDACCLGGECTPACDEGQTLCGFDCADINNNADHCGACGDACGDGACCQAGECVSFVCDYSNEPYGWDLCGADCVQTSVDNDNCGECGNVCGDGTCCNSKGGCDPVCGDDTLCDEQCADLQNDSSHCGECGNVCGEGSCCYLGECAPLECKGQTLCADGCVNLDSDPRNCGECGLDCDGYCCYEGFCGGDLVALGGCGEPDPTPGICPNPTPTEPSDLYCFPQSGSLPATCPNDDASGGEGSNCSSARTRNEHSRVVPASLARLGASGLDAPICETAETTQTIEPGQSTTTCTPGGTLFREVATTITVCGDGLPGVDGLCEGTGAKATTGTFNRLVADTTIALGKAYVTPFRVRVIADTSNDGLIGPGESGSLVIETLNAGATDITNATATLFAPDVDLSDDGIDNPVGLNVEGGAVSYGTILGTPATANCAPAPLQPASNTPAFPITVPLGHPGVTGHPVVLTVNGIVDGELFSMEVPLTLGIADGCDAAAHSRDFNGIFGLLNPMADLVPSDGTVPFAANTFQAGRKRMLRLRVLCGTTELTDADVDPPQIVALSEAVRGPIDVSTLFDERQQSQTQLFTWDDRNPIDRELDDETWAYELRTSGLGTGRFTITIRIAGRKDYVTGFELE